MHRSVLALGLAALLVSAFSIPPPAPDTPPTTVVTTRGDHTVTIEYLGSRGLWRPARITVQSRPGARAPWRGALQSVRLDGLQRLTAADRARWSREGHTPTAVFESPSRLEAEILAPAPENLQRIWFRASGTETHAIKIWTDTHNPSTHGATDDDDDNPPKDPDTGDDGDDDTDDDDSPWGTEEEWGDECPRPANDCMQYDMILCICVGWAESEDSSWSSTVETEGATMEFDF